MMEHEFMDENDSVDQLCMGCLASKDNEGICPMCGFDENNYQSSLHHLPLRTILNGKYFIGRVLGEGGFGITYLGWDLNLDLKVAIKEYYPVGFVTRENTTTNTVAPYIGEKTEFFQNGRKKFVDEAKRLAKFYALPGIVSIKDFFLENGTAYIVMEYVEGETLKNYLSRMGGKLPAEMIFDLMKPLLNSLIEIHKVGIIHRDISPDNIMITKEGNLKLIDFGAAREYTNSGNRSLSVMLKPGYAPEEQYRSRGVQGPWTDIYALCATIYKTITGITPEESIERVYHDELKKPSELGYKINPHQEDAIMKGMAILQNSRYTSIKELYNTIYDLNLIQNIVENKNIFVTHDVVTNQENNKLINSSDRLINSDTTNNTSLDIKIDTDHNRKPSLLINKVFWRLLALLYITSVFLINSYFLYSYKQMINFRGIFMEIYEIRYILFVLLEHTGCESYIAFFDITYTNLIKVLLLSMFNTSLLYFMGKNGGKRILNEMIEKSIISKEKYLKYHNHFLQRYRLSISIGRLIPLYSSFVSYEGGITNIRFQKFFIYSLVGVFIKYVVLSGLYYFIDGFQIMSSVMQSLPFLLTLISAFFVLRIDKVIKSIVR
jgi:serine/threonine protein kinase/membrane protein DedA with SNARE-associated domain